MTTLAEIEAAVESLPVGEQQKLFLNLARRFEDGPTCYDLTKEIFEEPGHLLEDGPPDLSTNQKYMADYGRRGHQDPR